jgi:hypothetical protein
MRSTGRSALTTSEHAACINRSNRFNRLFDQTPFAPVRGTQPMCAAKLGQRSIQSCCVAEAVIYSQRLRWLDTALVEDGNLEMDYRSRIDSGSSTHRSPS